MRGNFLVAISKDRKLKPWLIAVRLFLIISLALWSLGPTTTAVTEEQQNTTQSTETAPTTQQEQPNQPSEPQSTESQPLNPYITTDKDDYSPGQSVVVTGGGFASSEPVRVVITDADGDVVQDNTVTASKDGSVYDTYLIPADGTASLEYFVTATGQTSGAQATARFTDTGAVIISPFEILEGPGAGSADPDQVILAAKLTISSAIYSAQATLLDDDADGTNDLTIDDDNPRVLGDLAAGEYYLYWNLDKNQAVAAVTNIEKFQVVLNYSNSSGGPVDQTVSSPWYTVTLENSASINQNSLRFIQAAPSAVTAGVGDTFEVRIKYENKHNLWALIAQAYYDGSVLRLLHTTIYFYNGFDPGSIETGVPGGYLYSFLDSPQLTKPANPTLFTETSSDDYWVFKYEFRVLQTASFTFTPYVQTKESEKSQWKVDTGFATQGAVPGTISGIKFNDANGNGIKDSGETGLSGWTIYLKDSTGTNVLAQTTTNSDGSYYFSNVQVGTYVVAEQLQGGWTQTYPAAPGTYTVTIDLGENETGKDFGNTHGGTITGHKFVDVDGNGVMDGSDYYYPGGWTIYLKSSDGSTTIDTKVTDSNGAYTFSDVPAGTYWVEEESKTGWACTTGNPVTGVTVTAGGTTTVDFGNFQTAYISGYKFNDQDGDGQWDLLEPALSGWTITATKGQTTKQDTTDQNGNYSFSFNYNETDSWTISETLQNGWTQTKPINPNTYTVSVSSGTNSTGNNFGNFQNATVSGHKFHDLNGDADWDGGEPPLSGWSIYAEKGHWDGSTFVQDGPWKSDVTDGSGDYDFSFGASEVGIWRIREHIPAGGWIATTGSVKYVTIASGTNSQDNNFGNFQRVSISGTKYNDLNGDGDQDLPSETGIAGWRIFLDTNSNGIWDPTETYTLTDSNGDYIFTNLGPGTYKVTEESQTGWYPTTVTYYNVTVSSGTNVTDKDFGNRQYTDISVTKDDSPDPVEPGEVLTYTIVVTNNGPSTAENVSLSDTPPTGLESVQYSTDGGSSWSSWPGGNQISLGSIPYPGQKTVLLRGTVTTSMPIPTSLSNTAVVATTTYETDYTNNEDTEQTDVVYADVSVIKSDAGFDPSVPGGLVTYTILVTNLGPSTAENVFLSDTPPLGSPQYSLDGGLSWNPWLSPLSLGNISYQKTVLLRGTVTTSMPIPTSLSNTAVVSSDTYDPDLTNNQDTEQTAVIYADVSVTKDDSPDPIAPGGTLTYTVVVTNNGPSAAQDVVLTETYDPDFSFTNATPSPDFGTNDTWSLGTIASGDSRTITITGQVSDQAIGTLLNRVDVSTSTYDTDLTNNYDEELTSVIAHRLTITPEEDTNAVGENHQFTVKLEGNSGGSWYPVSGETIDLVLTTPGYLTSIISGTVTDPQTGWGTTDLSGTILVNVSSTSPGTSTLTASDADGLVEDVTFTDQETANKTWVESSISGYKFDDLDHDGVWDQATEPGLKDWIIFIDYNDDGQLDKQTELWTTTASNGSYIFQHLTPGNYLVTESFDEQALGWLPTSPAADPNHGYRRVHDVQLGVGQDLTDLNFGNMPGGYIEGYVWHDVDRDQIRDAGEPPLEGWVVTLYASDGMTVLATQLSQITGYFRFDNLLPGTYHVTETLQSIDWENTTPIKRQVDLVYVPGTGDWYQGFAEFGNVQAVLPFTPEGVLPRTGENTIIGINSLTYVQTLAWLQSFAILLIVLLALGSSLTLGGFALLAVRKRREWGL